MNHPWVTRWESDDQQELLFPCCWKSSCCMDSLTDHWDCPGISATTSQLWTIMSVPLFFLLLSLVSYGFLAYVLHRGNRLLVLGHFWITYGNSVPHTPKIIYVGTEPNLFWKRFYLPSQLLLLKHFDTPVVDAIQEWIWLSPPSCERMHAEMPMQSPKADSEVLQTHIHTHGCSQSRVRATKVSRWPQFIVWTERRPKGKW